MQNSFTLQNSVWDSKGLHCAGSRSEPRSGRPTVWRKVPGAEGEVGPPPADTATWGDWLPAAGGASASSKILSTVLYGVNHWSFMWKVLRPVRPSADVFACLTCPSPLSKSKVHECGGNTRSLLWCRFSLWYTVWRMHVLWKYL